MARFLVCAEILLNIPPTSVGENPAIAESPQCSIPQLRDETPDLADGACGYLFGT